MDGGPPERAASMLRRLGHGINIMTTALPFLTTEDWLGLAQRVQHVRLCGSVVEPLINWSTCPAATKEFQSDAEAVRLLRRSRFMHELKEAAEAARRAGLKSVINPMHRLFTLEVRPDTLRWVWSAMLLEFDEATFPPSDHAFELTNEPGNYHNHTVVGARFIDMVPALLHRIAASQPSRVVIVGGEMGRRVDDERTAHAGPTDGNSHDAKRESRLEGGHAIHPSEHARAAASNVGIEFVNSGPALIRDASHVRRLARRYPIIATFHFYKPRNFTSQGNADVIHPQRRWFGSIADVAELAEQFDAVQRGLGGQVATYLGEFGVNIDGIPHVADGVNWLRVVRSLCEARHFGWAYWTYYQSVKAATTARTASERLAQFDCSPHMGALFDFVPRNHSACPSRMGGRSASSFLARPQASRAPPSAAPRRLASGSSSRTEGEPRAVPRLAQKDRSWCDDRRPLSAQPHGSPLLPFIPAP